VIHSATTWVGCAVDRFEYWHYSSREVVVGVVRVGVNESS